MDFVYILSSRKENIWNIQRGKKDEEIKYSIYW